ncbi:MAG: sodium-dependent transporter [Planctomycetia bacterium]|nr:sodium-dependent transporter [Planctomycetia bacterium]
MVQKKRENWGSQIGAILAVAGCAIGLGNFLRFPGQAALYGGGAFMIPYFIAFLLLAIPLSWAEWALGRSGGRMGFNSVPGIFRSAGKNRVWAYIGTIGAIIPLGISVYYVYIQAWCLAYALQYLTMIFHTVGFEGFSFLSQADAGARVDDYGAFFANFIGINENGAVLKNGILSPLILTLLFCFVFNYTLIYRGISKGIEAFCKIAMPLLLVCSFLILFRVVTLGNPTGIEGQSFLDGLGFMWNPAQKGGSVWDTLSNPEVWLAATSQIFFSVSLGFGLIVTYASYVKSNDDIALSGLTSTSGNEFCEVVLGGLMIIPPAIMFLGLSALTPESLGSSFSMGFVVLPNVFEMMPGGPVFGFLFFFLLFLAAVTSAISMSQPAVAFLEEALNFSRKASVITIALICAVGTSLVGYFSKNLLVLDTFDFWIGSVGLFVLATLQTVLVAWIWGEDKMVAELNRGAKMKIPRFIGFVLKYISTPYLVVILCLWCWKKSGAYLRQAWNDPIVQIALGFLATVAIFFLVVTYIAEDKLGGIENEEGGES